MTSPKAIHRSRDVNGVKPEPPWTHPPPHIERFEPATSSSASAESSSSLPQCGEASLVLVVQQVKAVDHKEGAYSALVLLQVERWGIKQWGIVWD